MKRIYGLISFVLALAVMLSCMSAFSVNAVAGQTCAELEGSNVDAQNYYWNWATPIESYLAKAPDGTLFRFQAGAIEGKYYVEYYDASFNITNFRFIDEELPLFGGFHAMGSNYYVLTGNVNPEESATVECYRITKYDKNWNRIDSVGLYDCNTTVPFDAGCPRFAECGKYLLIRTDHEMYTSSDGLNHQANVTIQVDTTTMTITDHFADVMNSSVGYVSHSFNQFIHVEDNKIVAVDHGDAYPRSIVLIKYGKDVSSGSFYSWYNSVYDILEFPGGIGDNYTGATIGGFEISKNAYLVAYSSVLQDDNYYNNDTHNIYVASMNKKTDEITHKKITNFSEGEAGATTPHLVKLSDSEFMLLWGEKNGVSYVKLDSNGNKVGSVKKIENANLSDCQPVISNGKLVWYTYEDSETIFYSISVSDISKYEIAKINSGHEMKVGSYPTEPGGKCTVKCRKCSHTETFETPTEMKILWDVTGSGSYYQYLLKTEFEVNDEIYFWVIESGNSNANFEKVITANNPSVVYNQGWWDDSFKFLSEGIFRLKFYYVYNPSISYTYTVKVGDVTLGDVDRSGEITAADYVLAKRAVMGTYAMNDTAFSLSDINGDGNVSASDYVLLKRHVMGTYEIKE